VQFFPGSFGLFGVVAINVATSLAIAEIKVVETIVALNDVGRPEVTQVDRRQGGHIHDVVVPVLHVVAIPQRRCSRCQHLIVGSGVDVINVSEFHDGWVGEVTGKQGVAGSRAIGRYVWRIGRRGCCKGLGKECRQDHAQQEGVTKVFHMVCLMEIYSQYNQR